MYKIAVENKSELNVQDFKDWFEELAKKEGEEKVIQLSPEDGSDFA